MKEIIIKNKQKYLNKNYDFSDLPKITEKKYCIHCGKIINVKDYKVFKDDEGFEFICCPNAPECDGTIFDWFDIKDVPWLWHSMLSL